MSAINSNNNILKVEVFREYFEEISYLNEEDKLNKLKTIAEELSRIYSACLNESGYDECCSSMGKFSFIKKKFPEVDEVEVFKEKFKTIFITTFVNENSKSPIMINHKNLNENDIILKTMKDSGFTEDAYPYSEYFPKEGSTSIYWFQDRKLIYINMAVNNF